MAADLGLRVVGSNVNTMNRFAYRTTGLFVKVLENLSRTRVNLHGTENIPGGNNIFVVNHFTRIETFVLPTHLFRLTQTPIWSLAAAEFFKGAFGTYMDNIGAVSVKNPDRDHLIVKTLLTGEAMWIIFPEGRMVKNKKIIEKGRFMISSAGGKHPPHTGAATLAMRTEFYRQRLLTMNKSNPEEADRLLDLFRIESMADVSRTGTRLVPVNITYYPVRARENALSNIAKSLVENISDRLIEELMTEGHMLLSGVDMDIRFGKPIEVDAYLNQPAIQKDIQSKRPFQFDDPLPSKAKLRKSALKVMQRYMTDIYSLTTLNHDHIFASMLKLFPFSRIKKQDLRRRVFLAASSSLRKMNVYCHSSLNEEQTHLLVDDGYGKCRDFISLAKEQGFVKEQGGNLIKLHPIGVVLNFHLARIQNLVSVIANEVEPLIKFQRLVRRIAWQPSFMIRRKVVRSLLEKAINEYDTDYKAFFVEKETKDRAVGMPALFKGRSKRVGVVLSHGYMAAPLEVQGLAKYLQRKGFWVYTPRLKGHGTSPEDLAQRTYKDWLASVEEGYALISSICERVVIGGFSTGAGLALHIAARAKGLSGVFAIAAPLRLQDLGARFASTLDAWNHLMDRIGTGAGKKEFVNNLPENPHINYFRNPISGVSEIENLMESLYPLLEDITVPALIVQSENDPVVNPKGSRKIFKRLGSVDKRYTLFNFDRHGILLGEGSDRVYRTIAAFIDHLSR
ncbi:MAG: glycerol acyltransferase [Deltaproteobacteria bacterium]|nr:MAG: glycerol acyltransferase [Deltaproteobacteria bacterium]